MFVFTAFALLSVLKAVSAAAVAHDNSAKRPTVESLRQSCDLFTVGDRQLGLEKLIPQTRNPLELKSLQSRRKNREAILRIIHEWRKCTKYTSDSHELQASISVTRGYGKVGDFNSNRFIYLLFSNFRWQVSTIDKFSTSYPNTSPYYFILCLISVRRQTTVTDVTLPWSATIYLETRETTEPILSKPFTFGTGDDRGFFGTVRYFKEEDMGSVMNKRPICRFTTVQVRLNDADRATVNNVDPVLDVTSANGVDDDTMIDVQASESYIANQLFPCTKV